MSEIARFEQPLIKECSTTFLFTWFFTFNHKQTIFQFYRNKIYNSHFLYIFFLCFMQNEGNFGLNWFLHMAIISKALFNILISWRKKFCLKNTTAIVLAIFVTVLIWLEKYQFLWEVKPSNVHKLFLCVITIFLGNYFAITPKKISRKNYVPFCPAISSY